MKKLGTQIIRKIEYSYQTGSAMVLKKLSLPHNGPKYEACTRCLRNMSFSTSFF